MRAQRQPPAAIILNDLRPAVMGTSSTRSSSTSGRNDPRRLSAAANRGSGSPPSARTSHRDCRRPRPSEPNASASAKRSKAATGTPLVDQPLQHLARTIRRVAGQPLRVELEALVCPFDHGLGCFDLGLAHRGRGLHIDNDGVIQIDQVVGRVGEGGLPAMGTGPDQPAR